jgi:hypothetical protein
VQMWWPTVQGGAVIEGPDAITDPNTTITRSQRDRILDIDRSCASQGLAALLGGAASRDSMIPVKARRKTNGNTSGKRYGSGRNATARNREAILDAIEQAESSETIGSDTADFYRAAVLTGMRSDDAVATRVRNRKEAPRG